MLNGVGGRTVAEAKERMSFAEALDWQTYIERRGSLNLGMRMEAGFALLAAMISRANGGTATVDDFMPHLESQEATLEDVMKMLSGKK